MVPLGSDYAIFLHDYRLREALIAEANAQRVSGNWLNRHRSLIQLLHRLIAHANANLMRLGETKSGRQHGSPALSRN